jgi:hypothetical protein
VQLPAFHPAGSQADPPGVSTHLTGPPEFDSVDAPALSGPQGMPIAGRVSRPCLRDVDGAELGLVVCGTVVGGAAVREAVTGAEVVVFGDVVVAVVGALTTGCRGAARRTGGGGISAGCDGVVDSADLLSTLVGG